MKDTYEKRLVRHLVLANIREIIDGKYENEHVSVRGWVYRKREGKRMIFLVLRDSTGVIQCTVKKESELLAHMV